MKRLRRRSSSSSSSTEPTECPVCFEALATRGPRTEVRPFQCMHAICRRCDHQMVQRNQNRCPTCRRPRNGMTVEEAEPPPDPGLAPPGASAYHSLGPTTFFAFPYRTGSGGRGGGRGVGRGGRHAGRHTGQSPLPLPPPPPPPPRAPRAPRMDRQTVRSVLQSLLSHVAREGRDSGSGATHVLVTHVMPGHLIDALVDHPSASIAEWNAMREAA